jgi:hypothetical protein
LSLRSDCLLRAGKGRPYVPVRVRRFPRGAPAQDRPIPCPERGQCRGVRADASGVQPARGLISRDQWNGIIRGSAGHLWLYGMAEFGYATDDEVPVIVAEAATQGCQVRVLLLSPDYEGIPDLDASEGSPPGTLGARIRAALARFSQMRQACSGDMQLRVYDTHPTVSVVRGDADMLVTPYLRYFIGSNSPTLGLAEESAPKMFGRYARHFDGMWNLATEWTP